MVIVVMGVSGSGKTTVGRALAARMGASFVEADELHPSENVRKMESGIPLEDEDRWGWLERVRAEIEALLGSGRAGVVACSALKRRYRDVLRRARGSGDAGTLAFVYLRASPALVRTRIEGRTGAHFMPASLLESQFEALEEPAPEEGALTLDIEGREPETIVEEALRRLGIDGDSRGSGAGAPVR